ncbi:hypothetical protein BTS2_1222 [Bacillus sp. TS-2]|nr:hypothetical protein BTS2_1222 [Bacillus sp. TS-2]
MEKFMIIIIIFSLVFFLYNKIRFWRTPESLLKQIYQSQANLSLGFLMLAFGINLFVNPRSAFDTIIGIIFAIVGAFNIFHGYRAIQHYLPQLEKN